MKYKWFLIRWKLRELWQTVSEPIVSGYWLLIADFFWLFPAVRERYYAYREAAWKSARPAMGKDEWVRERGLISLLRGE